MDIISAGLIVADILVSPLDKSIFDKDSARIAPVRFCTGGDAFNVACNMKKLGLDVGVAGVVGNDMSGTFIKKSAYDLGINIEKLYTSEKSSTSTSVVLCEKNGERHFAYNGMANDEFDGSSLTDEFLSKVKMLHIGSAMALNGLDGDNLAYLLKRTKKLGLMTSMDTTSDSDGLWYEKIKSALPFTDIFIPSYDEAVNITNEIDIKNITGFLLNRGVKIAGVKLGENGCYIKGGGVEYRLPAYKSYSVVDTTGAGDAFMSGFLCGIIKNVDLYDCARLGSAASYFCIQQFGAVTNTKGYDETLDFVKSYETVH